ncbi:MAG: pyridoxine 5'-phosphate synthase [Candidatus Omnitrophica bacterium]|nr:pyridoxine 5'-phosphate synthase [Candidatus Omnitrophota bacterium]
MPKLGVNVDHVATLRQARRGFSPSPLWAAKAAQAAGAEGIVAHLREDRRHIQEEDLWGFKRKLSVPLNLEMAAHPGIVSIALRLKPDQATLVPERRQELTTEGGLDLFKGKERLREAILRLRGAGVRVSLFIDPDPQQIDRAVSLGAHMVELHTGAYAQAKSRARAMRELSSLREAAREAQWAGLIVAAGHGLDYRNVRPVARISGMEELNIGFSIVAHALEVGFPQAVREMARLVHPS